MFKDMKLVTKMACGFGILIIICAILGYTGFSSLKKVELKVEIGDNVNLMVKQSLEGRQHEKNFMLRKDKQYFNNAKTLNDEIHKLLTDTNEKLDDAATKETIDGIGKDADNWFAALTEYVSMEDQKAVSDATMVEKARAAISEIEAMRADQKNKLLAEIGKQKVSSAVLDRLTKADDANHLNTMILEARRQEKNFIIRGNQKNAESVDQVVKDILDLCTDLKVRFNDAANDQQADAVINAVNAYKQAFDKYVSLISEQKKVEETMVLSARELQSKADGLRQKQKDAMNSTMSAANILMLLLAAGGLVLGIILAYFITIGIVRPINKVIEGMTSGAEQVAAASHEVSSSSQQMAEGASEQASSLEETSSSLEELTSMTKQNTGNANQANTMACEATKVAEQGTEAMKRMTDAINRIKISSDETAKIIKTIDEIAFQTNLLALNAAVEAARAGEAGMGFAVVAEEVRNLTQRSAEAAKITTKLIEESQLNADNGVHVTNEVAVMLKSISLTSQKLKQLIGEVSSASEEQAEGINQINTAMSQMDQVTQTAAANADESASASEELSSQAAELSNMVDVLSVIIGGSNNHNNKSLPERSVSHKPMKTNNKENKKHQKILAMPKHTTGKAKTKALRPDDVIPLDDDEFEEF